MYVDYPIFSECCVGLSFRKRLRNSPQARVANNLICTENVVDDLGDGTIYNFKAID